MSSSTAGQSVGSPGSAGSPSQSPSTTPVSELFHESFAPLFESASRTIASTPFVPYRTTSVSPLRTACTSATSTELHEFVAERHVASRRKRMPPLSTPETQRMNDALPAQLVRPTWPALFSVS